MSRRCSPTSSGTRNRPSCAPPPRRCTSSRASRASLTSRSCPRGADPLEELRASRPSRFAAWSPLNRAAYLEMVTLLSPYLLAAQGDRMSLAHGVESRYPFLDHRLFEFAARLPTSSKLRGLREKAILRRWARDQVPAEVQQRPKQPYRAPDIPAFFSPEPVEYVRELLNDPNLARSGMFEPRAVAGLMRRCQAGVATGGREIQALFPVGSAALWYRQLMADAAHVPPRG